MESDEGSIFLFEHDLIRPCFARRSGFAKAGNRFPLFGIMLYAVWPWALERAACAAASRAIGTRNGEQET